VSYIPSTARFISGAWEIDKWYAKADIIVEITLEVLIGGFVDV